MRAAFYECDITPPLGGFLWGHYERLIATDVQDRLYAKAMVIEEGGTVAAFVCVDSCSIPAEMHQAVTQRIFEYTGIPEEQVCLTFNHTHWGAPIKDEPSIDCYGDAAYRDVCFRLTADAVILAYRRLQEATASFGVSELAGYSFNRDYVMEDGRAITWGKSPLRVERMLAGVDNSVSVLRIEQEGRPVGALVNYALHQCCCGDIAAYTGDYSSILSKELKKQFGEDFVCVFLLGCCGDINHLNDDRVTKPTPNTYREIGAALAGASLEAMKGATPLTAPIAVERERVSVGVRQADPEETRRRIAQLLESDKKLMRLRNLVYYQATNRETHTDLYVQAIRIGSLCIYALPGEVFVNLGLELKAACPFPHSMVVECCNSDCGYIPTEEAFREEHDLYEATLCWDSRMVPETGALLVERALALSKRLKEEK